MAIKSLDDKAADNSATADPAVAPTEASPPASSSDPVLNTPAVAEQSPASTPAGEVLEGTGTDNSPAVAVATPRAASDPATPVSAATEVPPAHVVPPPNVYPQNVSPAVSEVPTASVADTPKTNMVHGEDITKLPVITDIADILKLKEGQKFLAKFAHDPAGDSGWSAKQILKELMNGSIMRHGISMVFWASGAHKERSPIGQKQGRNFIMLD